ncbi:MAG: tetratricopeptide repeat protein [Candidatus Obscuribacterales bacterium]|nr:tetratricopeptide repeat protein [Candidatus Obscuribacterales bacterium]
MVAEVIVLLVSIVFLATGHFKLATIFSRYLPRFAKTPKAISKAIKIFRGTQCSVLIVIAIIASVDFIAFSVAIFGSPVFAARLYKFMPTSQLVGLHPAYTLESLAGAFVAKGDFVKAESLYMAILDVRQHFAGPKSDLVAALYVDLGDLNIRKRDLSSAEHWYRRAIDLAPSSGRALTALATTLREKGSLVEAETYYVRALDCRSRTFGKESKQYRDTKRSYEKLLEMKKLMLTP